MGSPFSPSLARMVALDAGPYVLRDITNVLQNLSPENSDSEYSDSEDNESFESQEVLLTRNTALGVFLYQDGSCATITRPEALAQFYELRIEDFHTVEIHSEELSVPGVHTLIVHALVPEYTETFAPNEVMQMFFGPIFFYKFISEHDDSYESWRDLGLVELSQWVQNYVARFNETYATSFEQVDLLEMVD